MLLGTALRGVGGGIIWVFSTQLLLQLVPGNVRGRVFATEFAFFNLLSALSSAAVGAALDSSFSVSARHLVDGRLQHRAAGGLVGLDGGATANTGGGQRGAGVDRVSGGDTVLALRAPMVRPRGYLAVETARVRSPRSNVRLP